MSDAIECDRCGSLESGEPAEKVATKSVSVEDSPPAGSIKIERVENIPAPTSSSIEWDVVYGDLCEDCAEAFREFWEGGDEALTDGGRPVDDDRNEVAVCSAGLTCALEAGLEFHQFCDAVLPEGEGSDELTCTRPEGHAGPHVACAADDHGLAAWGGEVAGPEEAGESAGGARGDLVDQLRIQNALLFEVAYQLRRKNTRDTTTLSRRGLATAVQDNCIELAERVDLDEVDWAVEEAESR